ncbi:DUF4082 domain-containing protein [Streptomyces sp. ID05-26A]|nr:DUF4082 domain-containing protein [Streptomyces sp. ID05-26A]
MTDYSVFGATPGPAGTATDGQPLNLAHQVNVTAPCWALGLRYYRVDTSIAGAITGRLWLATGPSSGTLVEGSPVSFADPGPATGWQVALFPEPIPLANGSYKPTVRFPDRWPNRPVFWEAGGAGENGISSGPLTAPNAASALGGQGSFSAGAATVYPSIASSFASDYGVDLLVTDTDPTGGGVAEYTVAEGDLGKYEITLAAGIETTVTFSDDLDQVEISNDNGAGRVYFTVDGTPATVRGPRCRQIPAAMHYVRANVYGVNDTVVRLISEAATMVSVAKASG